MEGVDYYSLNTWTTPSQVVPQMAWAAHRVSHRLGLLGVASRDGSAFACRNLYSVESGTSTTLHGAQGEQAAIHAHRGRYGERRFGLVSEGREIVRLIETSGGGLGWGGFRLGGSRLWHLEGESWNCSYGPSSLASLALDSPRLTIRGKALARTVCTLQRSRHRAQADSEYRLVTLFLGFHVASYQQWDLDRS